MPQKNQPTAGPGPRIVSGSRRRMGTACARARLPLPRTNTEIAEVFLRLLVEGIDHNFVGHPNWVPAMLYGAPRDATPGGPRVDD